MVKELRVLYLMALGKNPTNFRIWATHHALMVMFMEGTLEKIGFEQMAPNPTHIPTFDKEMKNKIAQMVLDYVRFDDGK